MDGSHSCAGQLKAKLERAEWLIARIYEDLPRERDWLNPDYEKEMKLSAGA
jgi:hypothetical protein